MFNSVSFSEVTVGIRGVLKLVSGTEERFFLTCITRNFELGIFKSLTALSALQLYRHDASITLCCRLCGLLQLWTQDCHTRGSQQWHPRKQEHDSLSQWYHQILKSNYEYRDWKGMMWPLTYYGLTGLITGVCLHVSVCVCVIGTFIVIF